MADELTISVALAYDKSGVRLAFEKTGVQIDVSGTEHIDVVQSIGTSQEALDIGDITTCGYCILVNLDATNYVTIRPGSGLTDLVKLKAGEVACFRLAGSTPYAIANTAACRLRVIIIED